MLIMREKIMAILKDLHPELDYEVETKLIDDGLFDSFDIVTLVFELSDEFDTDIDVNELVPDNFNSIDAMVELVKEKTA